VQNFTSILKCLVNISVKQSATKSKDDFDGAITHFKTCHSHSDVQITHFCTIRMFYVRFPGIT
jgi:hypothetical protein